MAKSVLPARVKGVRFMKVLWADRPYVWPSPVNWVVHTATYSVPAVLLAIVALQPWEDPALIFLDALVAAEVAPQCCSVAYGFMSQLGIFIWISTSAVCLFAGALMLIKALPGNLAAFAISAGLLTGWLGIDDAFLLHEKVFPKLGVPQNAVLASYIALTLAYVASSWRILLKSDFSILAIGGAAFACSLGIDIVLHNPAWIHLEDSAKFLGICCWGSFHVSTLLKMLSAPFP